ncbi:MAG TPA: phage tail tape measure protein [Amaricoccus sp.]|uniref:phage tail tape measure protein n=1 Tax=Amaricoccus sp. TaxID=1872485 RepID=UPI002C724DE6|nr:phage tail tape measure protein [Amaricoccus sp.]HMR51183.1 phage tail tape measure protein [Amaricoccus sp.]HMT98069.1 phage tail tape measure protein [Amaricoccus sp.]
MASAVVGALRVNLGLDTAAFQEGLKGAKSRLAKFGSIAKTGALAVAAAAAASAGALAVSMRGAVNAADDMSKAALKIGIPTEELSRLKYAADLSGVSFAQLQTGVGRLSQNMSDAAKGVGEGAEAFEALGISVTDADGNLRSSSDVMRDIADRFAAMPEGAEKTALAMDLMGRAGKDMIPLLNGGSDALGKLMAEADTFGQVFTDEMGKNAEAFNDNLSRLGGAFGAISADLAERLLPYLVQFTDWLVQNAPAIAEVVASVIEFGIQIVQAGAAVGAFVADTLEAVRQFGEDVKAAFLALPEAFKQIGVDVVDGLLAGLREKWAAVREWVDSAAQLLPAWFREWWGINSPSLVFAEIGANIMQGLARGLESEQGAVRDGMQSFAQDIAAEFGNILKGATDFRSALGNILGNLAGRFLDAGISGLGTALKLPGFANGTPFAPGGLALVGERGPELVNLPRGSQVIPNHALGGAQAVHVTVGIASDSGLNLMPYVKDVSQRAAAGAVGDYDRLLPDRIAGINRDPWKRG